MAKRIQEYVRYSQKELESYVEMDDACVIKVNTNLHISLNAYGLKNIRTSVQNYVVKKKIGFFEPKLNGIILEMKNIKIVQPFGAIRFDDSKIHLDILADCYVFQPHVGSIVRGVVRHVSTGQVGVILFRVFNVSIRLSKKNYANVKINEEVLLKIKDFNFQNVFPYIEGELVYNKIKKEHISPKVEKVVVTVEDSDEESDLSKLLREIKEEK